jgi:hypothetical protein
MLLVFANSTDISASVQESSFKLTEQLQSRRDTASFTTLQQAVTYGQVVTVYEGLQLTQPAASGQPVLNVADTYPQTNKIAAGVRLLVGIGGADQATYTVLSVDHAAKTVTLTANLAATFATTARIGKLHDDGEPLFAGICIKCPETEIGYTGTFTYNVQCADLSLLFDAKQVVMNFLNQYAREIVGRIVYFFCPPDTSYNVDLFDAAWTHGGVGLAMSDNADRIQGSYSQAAGTSGAGVATWTKTVTSVDLRAYSKLRFWWKLAAGFGNVVTALKLRIGQDASNYYEFDIANIGGDFSDCWNYESVTLDSPSAAAGSPTLDGVTWLQLSVTATAAMASPALSFDHMHATTGGFTLQNCVRGPVKFDDLRVSYRRPTDVIDDLAKRLSDVWYIDYNRDVHLSPQQAGTAPFSLDNTPGSATSNYGNLKIDPDITHLLNRIVVLGGEAPDANLYTQTIVADGEQSSFTLDYKMKTLSMTIDGTPQTLGEENLVDPDTVQYLSNFQEKVVRTSTAGTPTEGQVVVFTGFPYKPIRVRAQDNASIALMKSLVGGDGIFDGAPISDASIGSFEDALIRARAELAQYANAVLTATFETDHDGLHAGQVIRITDVNRGIDQDFLIQRVQYKQRYRDRFHYAVTAASVMYGVIEFFQMLVRRAQSVDLKPSDFLEIILNVDETVTVADAATYSKKSKTFTAALVDSRRIRFEGLAGSASSTGIIGANDALYGIPRRFTNWYAAFAGGETGTIQFASSEYNNDAELRITAAGGGSGKEAKATLLFYLPAYASTAYTIGVWLKVAAALTNVGTGGGARVLVKEYSVARGGTALVTNTLFSGVTAKQDFAWRQAAFTTGASTAYIGIELSLYQAAGTIAFSDILVAPTVAESQSNPAVASFSSAA